MAQFASIDELEKTLRTTVDDIDAATQQLEYTSSLIQAYTGQQLEYVANDTYVTYETSDGRIQLPERPVTAVTSVTIDGSLLTEDVDYDWTSDGIIYRRRLSTGWYLPSYDCDNGDRRVVTVVYSHGYQTIPDDIRKICCNVAAHGWGTGPGGIAQESIGNYSVSYHGPGYEVGGPETVVILGKYRGVTLK